MPNQADYPINLIPGSVYQRPSRLDAADLALLQEGTEQIILGTNPNDVTEVWVYNPDSTFAGHVTLLYNDPAMNLTTLVDNTGPYELVNIDFKALGNLMGLEAGRYAVTVNFFQDWVGSENGYQLYIQAISPDRTELRLYPVNVTSQSIQDTYNFVTPSVPPEFVNALIDQIFGQDLNPNVSSSISLELLDEEIEEVYPNTNARIAYAGVEQVFETIFNQTITGSFEQALVNMAANGFNYTVTQPDLMTYIGDAIQYTLYQMQQMNQIDPRFQLV